MSTCVVLIRHGDTPASQDGRFTGAHDISLSAEGRVHASELATRLSRYPMHAVYASSMRRAQETAQYIGQVHGLPVTPVAELREMDHGVWNGMSRPEIVDKYAGQIEKYDADPFNFSPEGGESGADGLGTRLSRSASPGACSSGPNHCDCRAQNDEPLVDLSEHRD